jgi:hypothetical protein
MHLRRKTTAATAFAAIPAAILALVAPAHAAGIAVKGPKTLRGAGFVALTIKGPASSALVLTTKGTKTLSVAAPKGAKLSVRCTGGAKARQFKPPAGRGGNARNAGFGTVVSCAGKNAGARIAGAKGAQLNVRLDATSYTAAIPKGFSGSYDLTQQGPGGPGGRGFGGAQMTAAQRKALQACLKKHGVTLPTPSRNPPTRTTPPSRTTTNPSRNDPKLQKAFQACRSVLRPSGSGR